MNESATIIELKNFQKWLTEERERTASTVSEYLTDLNRFLDWLTNGGDQLKTVQQSDITAYVAHLKGSDRAPSTVDRATVAIRSFFRFSALEAFRNWLTVERGRAPSTVSEYLRDLNRFLDWLTNGGDQLKTVQQSDITAYVAHLKGSDRAPSTVKRATVAIRSFFRFLAVEKMIETDPGASVEVPNVPRGLPKALPLQQIESLLASPVGDDPASHRDKAILEVLYGCGLRIGELVALELVDVDLDGRLLRVFGKGRRERIVPLGGPASDALEQWIDGIGRKAVLDLRLHQQIAEDHVFLSVGGPKPGTGISRRGAWMVVRGHGNRVGLGPELTPHVLRHSCATHMLVNGADIRYVQQLLGHRSISNTQRYTALRDEEIRKIYDRSHPRAEVQLQDK